MFAPRRLKHTFIRTPNHRRNHRKTTKGSKVTAFVAFKC